MTPTRFVHKVARRWMQRPGAGPMPRYWRDAAIAALLRHPTLARRREGVAVMCAAHIAAVVVPCLAVDLCAVVRRHGRGAR